MSQPPKECCERFYLNAQPIKDFDAPQKVEIQQCPNCRRPWKILFERITAMGGDFFYAVIAVNPVEDPKAES